MMLARVRDRTPKVEVLSFPDLSHPALTELLGDAVMQDCGAYHQVPTLTLADCTAGLMAQPMS